MPNFLFNRFGNVNNQQNNYSNDLRTQLIQTMKNPGTILDILLQRNKIDWQQYNELQQYKNNPEMIAKYLINKGQGNAINQAQQDANRMVNNS